jgi:hypothetical protein
VRKKLWFGLAVLAALSTGTAASAYAFTPSGPPPHPMAWIVSAKAITMLGQDGLNGHQLQQLFGNRDTFLTGTADGDPGVTGSTRTATFTSYQALSSALAAGHLPPGTQAVLYDNEDWPLTPAPEQHDPARYEQLAAGLAHAHHLLFISTPATDLTSVLAPGAASHYAAYLRLHLAGEAARYANVIDIQAQGAETDLATFVPFVIAAAGQARQANPRVIVLAGLSTNPGGQRITAGQLIAAAGAVRRFVNGFWLNIPAGGAACPRCGTPQPRVAIPLLHLLL